jgi:esterase/lipase superfamily enzyme
MTDASDTSARELLRVVEFLFAELRRLVNDWPRFAEALEPLLDRLRNESTADDATRLLFDLFAEHPVALQLLLDALAARIPVAGVKGRTPGFVAADTQWITVPIYYATDRSRSGSVKPNDFYGAGRGELTFGTAEVSIPYGHRRGGLERPTWWKFEFKDNPKKHVTLLSVTALDRDACVSRIKADLQSTSETSALVFVHGYFVAFADAARRAAQLAFDLEFNGVPILYSWPSNGSLVKYVEDGNNVKWSEPHFLSFLHTLVAEIGVQSVHIIAHSMGNRLVTETLKTLQPTAPAGDPGTGLSSMLSQLVLAAPDVDSDTFAQIAPQLVSRVKRVTLYASARDTALAFSQSINGYPRIGDAGDDLRVVAGVDTIDASDVDTGLFSLSHSYFADERSVLSDIYDLLKYGGGPDERYGLEPRMKDGARYWRYAP